jgi:hypothetical protein
MKYLIQKSVFTLGSVIATGVFAVLLPLFDLGKVVQNFLTANSALLFGFKEPLIKPQRRLFIHPIVKVITMQANKYI